MKKLIALVVVAALFATVGLGCGSDTTKSTKTSSSPTGGSTETKSKN